MQFALCSLYFDELIKKKYVNENEDNQGNRANFTNRNGHLLLSRCVIITFSIKRYVLPVFIFI